MAEQSCSRQSNYGLKLRPLFCKNQTDICENQRSECRNPDVSSEILHSRPVNRVGMILGK